MSYLPKPSALAILLILFSSSLLLHAQEITSEQKMESVNNISQLLIDHYVFPDVGKNCGDHLKARMEEGIFDNISDKKEFSEVLTKELQSISRDKHMRVRPEGGMMVMDESGDQLFQQFKFKNFNQENNFGFKKVEMLEGGIGYIDLRGFAQSPDAFDVAKIAMNFIKNSNAVIFDLRKNNGGSPEMIKFILSYFFDKPTHLNDLYWRDENRTEEFWTNEKVDGKRMSDVPVFVLTSNKTFSGGEEFAYNVLTQKRGTIIGEVTGGGANPGGMFPAGNGLAVFIPTGRAINPITKTNWEGVGVKPDIELPADDALDKALELAKPEAEKHKQKILSEAETNFSEFRNRLDKAEALFSTDNIKANEEAYGALNLLLQNSLAGEIDFNFLGYQYLGEKKYDMAIAILTFNTEKFSGSSNVWDSLGEAYMNSGNNKLAIKNYEKSLELDPGNENARQMIAKMKSGE
ncbi:MAG: S41 family peptidase [Ignavibacteriaceae bacterium]|nr:S41 family peptidase [Ignavibacteriaceae bacterium]